MQMRLTDLSSTSVAEIHEIICDTAVEIANLAVSQETRIPKKWRGPALKNGSPYSEGRLVCVIAEEYQLAPDKVKIHYRRIAVESIHKAMIQHGDLVAGMILGEARQGRNYFKQWPQAPTQLF